MERPNRPSVLVVEECADIARLEQAVASAYGCSASIATSGTEAIALLRAHDYDVVIVGSPFHAGAHQLFLDLLTGEFRRFGRRTIVVTSHVGSQVISALAAEAGVFAVVAKPFEVEALAELVLRCANARGAPAATMWIGVPEPADTTAVGQARG